MPSRATAVEWPEEQIDGPMGSHEALVWALIQAAERLGMTDAEADRLERAIDQREADRPPRAAR